MSTENEGRILPRHVMAANANLRHWSELKNPDNDLEIEAANQILKEELSSAKKFANKLIILGGAGFAATMSASLIVSPSHGIPWEIVLGTVAGSLVSGGLIGSGLAKRFNLSNREPQP